MQLKKINDVVVEIACRGQNAINILINKLQLIRITIYSIQINTVDIITMIRLTFAISYDILRPGDKTLFADWSTIKFIKQGK